MESTVMIALITAAAGIAGGLTTAAVSVLAASRQDRRMDSRERARWQRELAEKDRDKLYALFEDVVAADLRLYDAMVELLRQPTPQTKADQAGAVAAANELAVLAMRAEILGAHDVYSGPLAFPAREVRKKLREGPLDQESIDGFHQEYKDAGSALRDRMNANLRRLRTDP